MELIATRHWRPGGERLQKVVTGAAGERSSGA